jgi:hypothetical protein
MNPTDGLGTVLPGRRFSMIARSLLRRSAVPLGILTLGVLVVATGWLVLQGLPFLAGSALMCVFALGEIALLTTHPEDV